MNGLTSGDDSMSAPFSASVPPSAYSAWTIFFLTSSTNSRVDGGSVVEDVEEDVDDDDDVEEEDGGGSFGSPIGGFDEVVETDAEVHAPVSSARDINTAKNRRKDGESKPNIRQP